MELGIYSFGDRHPDPMTGAQVSVADRLAGHGPATTIGAERWSNPFLAGLAAPDEPGHAPPAVPGAPKPTGL